jgi:hypothetical protein
VFSPLLRARCCAALRTALRAAPARRDRRNVSFLSRALPARLLEAVRNRRIGRAGLEPLVLAFRAFVAARMQSLLRADAATPPARLEPAVNA